MYINTVLNSKQNKNNVIIIFHKHKTELVASRRQDPS